MFIVVLIRVKSVMISLLGVLKIVLSIQEWATTHLILKWRGAMPGNKITRIGKSRW